MPTMSEPSDNAVTNIMDIVSKCVKCRFCFSQCPVYEVSDKWTVNGASGITQSLYYAVQFNRFDEDLRDILMRCTTCGSCEIICSKLMAGVSLIDAIQAGRYLLLEKEVAPIHEQQKALESLQNVGNPYGKPPANRTKWASNTDINILMENETTDFLYFVGCVASYDDRANRIALSISKLMQIAGVPFSIMTNENCSGDPAYQMGESGLFDLLMNKNIKNIKRAQVNTIMTTSPHDFDSFLNHYENNLDGIQIKHYTDILLALINNSQLPLNNFKRSNKKLTFHDPCYLSKHHSIIDEPRQILASIPGVELIEMNRNRQDSLCCGGGGARMWADYDEQPRLSEIRVREAIDIGAEIIVTCCPFCLLNIEDAIKTLDEENNICAKDLSEIVLESIEG